MPFDQMIENEVRLWWKYGLFAPVRAQAGFDDAHQFVRARQQAFDLRAIEETKADAAGCGCHANIQYSDSQMADTENPRKSRPGFGETGYSSNSPDPKDRSGTTWDCTARRCSTFSAARAGTR